MDARAPGVTCTTTPAERKFAAGGAARAGIEGGSHGRCRVGRDAWTGTKAPLTTVDRSPGSASPHHPLGGERLGPYGSGARPPATPRPRRPRTLTTSVWVSSSSFSESARLRWERSYHSFDDPRSTPTAGVVARPAGRYCPPVEPRSCVAIEGDDRWTGTVLARQQSPTGWRGLMRSPGPCPRATR